MAKLALTSLLVLIIFTNATQNYGEVKVNIHKQNIYCPPGYSPIIEVETSEGKENITLKVDNHFINMLKYFYSQIINKDKIIDEYKQNINQARLIKEVRNKSYEK